MTRDQRAVTEYLLAENAVIRQQLRGRRIRYTDVQRRRLAIAAKTLGRKALAKIDTLVTPDTLLRWYRRLVARKYDGNSLRGHARPCRAPDIIELVLRMARENSSWGLHADSRRHEQPRSRHWPHAVGPTVCLDRVRGSSRCYDSRDRG